MRPKSVIQLIDAQIKNSILACSFLGFLKENKYYHLPYAYLIWIETYTEMYTNVHHFKSDLINKVDHMRISGTEPSSVILSQTK